MTKRRNRLTSDLPGSGEGALFDCFKKQRKSMATQQKTTKTIQCPPHNQHRVDMTQSSLSTLPPLPLNAFRPDKMLF